MTFMSIGFQDAFILTSEFDVPCFEFVLEASLLCDVVRGYKDPPHHSRAIAIGCGAVRQDDIPMWRFHRKFVVREPPFE